MKEMKSKLIRAIDRISAEIGQAKITADPDILETYSRDETSGLAASPEAVVRAQCTEDVSAVMKICSEENVPVIPRGAGTGVTGGAVPVRGGIVLSLEKMNRIIEIDSKNMIAVAEPGAITGDIQKLALESGLMYPPDPASLENCSIGGNIAENAGGPRAVKYGTTKDYVTGLEFVLADGTIITTGGKTVKNVTGYNLIGIILGSEGTLAVVTKIFLRLIPAPRCSIDFLIPFDTIDAAVMAVNRIMTGGISPAAIEFMERDAIELSAKYLGIDFPHGGAGALLIIQMDGNSEDEIYREIELAAKAADADMEKISVAAGAAQKDSLWKIRRAMREAIGSASPVFLAEDCSVPRGEIPEFIRRVKVFLNAKNLRSIIFGHAGDGNLHIDILKGDTDAALWSESLPGIKRKIYSEAVSLGGTITGEHGIGFIRKNYLGMALSQAEISLSRRIKQAFDPQNILNPGKLFDQD